MVISLIEHALFLKRNSYAKVAFKNLVASDNDYDSSIVFLVWLWFRYSRIYIYELSVIFCFLKQTINVA